MTFSLDFLKTFGKNVKKTIWTIASHAFSFILILVLIDLILGGLVFYKYVRSAEKAAPKSTESVIKFDTKTYQSVITELQGREQGAQ